MRPYPLLLVLLAFATPALAQQTPPPTDKSPVLYTVPAAAPKDVDSIESIVAALYDVISGPAGKTRDWNRMRSLFIPGAKLIPTGARPGGEVAMRLLDVNDFIATSGPLMTEKGFTERELAKRVDKFGHIAHVFSTYEGVMEKDDKVHLRGINSIQLMNDGKRWWILSVFWEAETPNMALPKEYLPKAQ